MLSRLDIECTGIQKEKTSSQGEKRNPLEEGPLSFKKGVKRQPCALGVQPVGKAATAKKAAKAAETSMQNLSRLAPLRDKHHLPVLPQLL